MPRVHVGDLLGGLVVFAVGVFFLIDSQSYEVGTLRRMGPGFFPMIFGGVAALLGLAIAATAVGRVGLPPRPEFRPGLAVLSAIAVFGLLLERFGLIPAAFFAVLVAAAGDRNSRPMPTLLLGVVVSVGCWIIFSLGIGLPMNAFEEF